MNDNKRNFFSGIALKGEITISSDKSMSHRALIFACMGAKIVTIKNLLLSDDIKNTKAALQRCGHDIYRNIENEIIVTPCKNIKKDFQNFYMGNSGTSTRLLIAYFASLGINAYIYGDKSLNNRPMQRVLTPVEKMGGKFTSNNGKLPITVLSKSLVKSDYSFNLTIPSAQVKSAILIAAFLNKMHVKIIEPQITRDHTENYFKKMGVNIESRLLDDNKNEIIINSYHENNLQEIDILGDPSSAIFICVCALLTKGSNIKVKNILYNDQRIEAFHVIKKMGAKIKWEDIDESESKIEKSASLIVEYSNLSPIYVDGEKNSSMIDEFPIIFVTAAFTKGKSVFKSLSELRVKESDRLGVMYENLKKLGVDCYIENDDFIINGKENYDLNGKDIRINSYNDHRIAMSFFIFSMINKSQLEIDNVGVINTSFPDFFNSLSILMN